MHIIHSLSVHVINPHHNYKLQTKTDQSYEKKKSKMYNFESMGISSIQAICMYVIYVTPPVV